MANERRTGGDANETWYASLPEPEYSHNWMHLLATIDLLEKRGTHMVKNESGLEGTIVPLRMINLVKHDKKLSSALPVKPNLQHVKQRNVIPTPSYTTTSMGDDGLAYVESNLQWLRYVQATTADHEFKEDWGRRMEEILVLVGSLKIEESSSEEDGM